MTHRWSAYRYLQSESKFHLDLGLMYKLNLSFMHSLEDFRRKSGLEVASMEFLHFA